MIDYLGTLWIGFLITWFFLLIIRTRLNYMIRKKQQQLLAYPVRPKSSIAVFFVSMFTLYNKPSKFEDPGFRRLKIWTNALHQVFVYGFIFMLIFSFIALIQHDIRKNERKRNAWRNQTDQANCIDDVQPRFGPEYNTIRSEKNLIPMPDDFCMTTYNEGTEIWEPENSTNQEYFHQAKHVYVEDGKWKGEYDIFVHREYEQPDEILTANFTDLDGTMDVLYLYNDMGISERKFIEMMREWGLEEKLWQLPSN
jgi:hypothetical protein